MKAQQSEVFWLNWCKEELNNGRPVRFKAKGVSMLPKIWPGQFLTIMPVLLHELEIGQVIAFQRNHHLVVHRIIAKHRTPNLYFQTQGDSNIMPDERVDATNFVGRIHLDKPHPLLGWTRPQQAPSPFQRTTTHRILILYRLALRLASKMKKLLYSPQPQK